MEAPDSNPGTTANLSGVLSAGFRIRIRKIFAYWIRIRMKNADPDPAAEKFVPRAKSQGAFQENHNKKKTLRKE